MNNYMSSHTTKEITKALGRGKSVLTHTAKEKEFYAKGHMRHDEGYNERSPMTIEEMERATKEFLDGFK